MTKLNKNTKKAQGFLQGREYGLRNHNFSIYSIYKNPSYTKIKIAEEIEKRLSNVIYHNGNSFNFTCSGFDTEGNLTVETKCNTYLIDCK